MLKKLRNEWINNSWIFSTKNKIIIYFIIVVIIVFFIFNSIFSRLYTSNIEQVVIKEGKGSVQKTLDFVDMVLKSMENSADVIQNNSLVLQQLEQSSSKAAYNYRTDPDIISTMQSIVANSVRSAASIDIYINATDKFYASEYGMYSDVNKDIVKYFLFLEKSNEKFILTDEYRKKLNFIRDRNYEQVSYVRPLYSISTGQKCGLVVINFNKFYLKTIIKGNTESSNLVLDKDNNIILSVISDSNDKSANSIEKACRQLKGSNGVKDSYINGEKYVLIYETSDYSNWKYINILPSNTSIEQISGLREMIFILFLAINLVTAIILILLMLDMIYKKLRKLITAMKEVENGNLNIVIKHNENDEFGYIYTSFNNMLIKIKGLFEQLYEQKLLQKDAELKLLQSKINPHFIYNIFDNMNWLIQLERYQELETLVDAVSGYFRKSLNAGKDFITVEDTIEQLKNYTQIQQIRFKNRFECTFDFEEEILSMIIPNFVLQPILENAICHGIEPEAEKCLIQVKGVRLQGKVFFTVEDDGAGIDQDKLKNVIEFLESGQTEAEKFYALSNINKRIKIYYGDEYGLTIRSTLGVGTKVTVIIPDSCILEVSYD